MNALTKTERIALLEEWLKEEGKIEAHCAALEDLFGEAYEGKIQLYILSLFEKYTKLIGEKVGDDSKRLAWFLYDNDRGKNTLKAKARSWKKARKIRTVKDLEALISAE